VAEKLTADLRGRVKLEDAGFDWKILGPDPSEVEYVVWQAVLHALSRAAHHAAHHPSTFYFLLSTLHFLLSTF